MKPDEFVERMRQLAPAKSVCISAGYSEKEADEFINAYSLKSRCDHPVPDTHGDALLELLDNWYVSSFPVGSICFFDTFEQKDGRLWVGEEEAEILAFCLDTKSYVLLEHECQYKVPWCDVAPSGANFLSGMLVMIDYWSKSGVNLIDMDDEITGVEYRSKCVEALGGSKYEGFGTSLFGW